MKRQQHTVSQIDFLSLSTYGGTVKQKSALKDYLQFEYVRDSKTLTVFS